MASEENKKQSAVEPSRQPEKKKNGERTVNPLKRTIRNPFVYFGTIAILIITIIAFVFIPAVGGGSSGSSGAPSFGSWNGKKIEYTADSYFADQVSQINDYLRQQGMDEQLAQLYAYQVWRLAFQNTVVRTAMLDTARGSGMRISEQTIDEAITKSENFQVDGKFSLEKYNATPLATRLAIRNRLRDDLMIQNFYGDVLSAAPSTGEIEFVASMAKPQREIRYVTVPYASFPDEKAIEWARANEKLFRSIGLSRITITTSQKDAEKVLEQVKNNQLSFEDAAKSHSKDSFAEKGGDLGIKLYYELKEEFSNENDLESLLALKKGELSAVYKLGDNRWAFFRVNSEASSPDFSRKDVLEAVRSYMFDREKGVLENWALETAKKMAEAASSSTLDAAAKSMGYAVKAGGPFMLNYGNPGFYFYGQQISLFMDPYRSDDPDLTGAAEKESFLTELFATPKGAVSKPVVLDGAVVVFTVTRDADAGEQETSYTKFSYPYFYQQAMESQIRSTILSSKKFKDEFNTTFAKIFTPKK
ncbi:MAG: SurA N-terminal domain-containing protein [Spirochaetaceae bacterium]|nr:SurA N-terminal domain-containing protein [Spirochaetaceae bacterium]